MEKSDEKLSELMIAAKMNSASLTDIKEEVKALTVGISKFREDFHQLDKTVIAITSSGFKEAIDELDKRVVELERFKYQFVGALVVAQIVWVAIFKFWK